VAKFSIINTSKLLPLPQLDFLQINTTFNIYKIKLNNLSISSQTITLIINSCYMWHT